jgi:hypothetical protein
LRAGLDSQYLLQPAPPLVVDVTAVGALSAAALRRNLGAHAAQNPALLVGGTKAEMAMRLTEVLERRAADLRVRSMLWGKDEQDGSENDEHEGSMEVEI